MAQKSRPTLMKREREKARVEKQKMKEARRADRSQRAPTVRRTAPIPTSPTSSRGLSRSPTGRSTPKRKQARRKNS